MDEFETDDPSLRGEMTLAITLSDADGGTDLRAVQRAVDLIRARGGTE